jgi:CHASE3 domain sensor protein
MPIRTVLGVTVALAGIILVALFAARAQQNQKRAGDWVQHTLEVQEQLAGLLTAVCDAETGQRGYLLTGRDAYLGPYTLGTSQVTPRLERLRSLTSDNPAQQRLMGEVQTLVGAKLAELADTVEKGRGGQRDAALARVQTDEGLKLMDGIRTAVRAMEREEARLMVERDRAWDAEASRAFRVITLGAVGLFLVTLLAGFASVRDYRVQMQARRTAEALAEELTQQGRELEHLMADAPARPDKGEG